MFPEPLCCAGVPPQYRRGVWYSLSGCHQPGLLQRNSMQRNCFLSGLDCPIWSLQHFRVIPATGELNCTMYSTACCTVLSTVLHSTSTPPAAHLPQPHGSPQRGRCGHVPPQVRLNLSPCCLPPKWWVHELYLVLEVSSTHASVVAGMTLSEPAI